MVPVGLDLHVLGASLQLEGAGHSKKGAAQAGCAGCAGCVSFRAFAAILAVKDGQNVPSLGFDGI